MTRTTNNVGIQGMTSTATNLKKKLEIHTIIATGRIHGLGAVISGAQLLTDGKLRSSMREMDRGPLIVMFKN